jgi:hypothetical protein
VCYNKNVKNLGKFVITKGLCYNKNVKNIDIFVITMVRCYNNERHIYKDKGK